MTGTTTTSVKVTLAPKRESAEERYATTLDACNVLHCDLRALGPPARVRRNNTGAASRQLRACCPLAGALREAGREERLILCLRQWGLAEAEPADEPDQGPQQGTVMGVVAMQALQAMLALTAHSYAPLTGS